MRTFVLLAVLGIFGMLVLAGCSGTNGKVAQSTNQESAGSIPAPQKQVTQTGQNPPSESSGKAPSNIENGEIGKTYVVNYMNSKYEVTLQKTAFTKPNNPYSTGNYLMAYFEIKNVGDSSEYFMPDIYAIDKEGEKYDATVAFGLSDEYDKTLDFVKKLTPNTKTSGWAAIEVPEGTNGIDLYFEYTNIFLSQKPNYIKYRIEG